MLYKYLKADRAINILETSKIRISQVEALNDPYECEPNIGFDSILEMMSLLGNSKQDLQGLIDDIASSRSFVSIFKDENAYDRFVLAHRRFPDLISRLLAGLRNGDPVKRIQTELISKIRTSAGVFSASKTWNNLLMWAHYADEHRGVVIGFDEKSLFDIADASYESSLAWKKVHYSKKREILDITDPDIVNRLLTEKPIVWSYEREYRFIDTFHRFENSGKVHNDLDVYVANINTSSVRKIYLGSRVKKENIHRITELTKNKFTKTKTIETKISRDSYDLIAL